MFYPPRRKSYEQNNKIKKMINDMKDEINKENLNKPNKKKKSRKRKKAKL